MKKLIVVIGLLVISNISISQWIYQNNIDSITTISSGSFINSNTGWYARSKGQISTTTDGGLNWSTITINTNDFNSIKFTSVNTGYVCGNNGCIMKSLNGGLNWSAQNISSNDTLVSLDFVNDLTGWCAGRDFIMYTSNGGSQWYRQNVDTTTLKPRFTYLKMYDVMNGLAGAYRKNANDMYAYIYRTSNGGANWNFVDSIYGYRITSICYVNQNILFISNYRFLYKSTNGGNNWQTVSVPLYPEKSKVHFISENTGWLTSLNELCYTTNCGDNWAIFSNHVPGGYYSEFNYITNGNIYTATEKGTVLKSTNGGTIWRNYSVNFESTLGEIKIIDANKVFIGGELGTCLKSTNSGNNWQINFRDSLSFYIAPFFINSSTGFIISAQSQIIKTTNCGENWFQTVGNTPYNLNRIYCKDENTFWVFGDTGMIFKTTNGGITWENNSVNIQSLVYGLKENNNTLFIQVFSGQNSSLFKSTNMGYNWINIYLDSLLYPFNLNFLNSQIGWITPTSGNIFYKSFDGGNTWTKFYRAVENGSLIVNSCFVNENTGYAATFSNFNGLLKTTNSGLNWFSCSGFTYNNRVTSFVSFLNENTGWVVGYHGLICKTTNGGTSFLSVNNQIIPDKFSLSQNYPNPFNPTTNIKYQITNNKFVTLKVFDILGKEIATLVNEKQNAGTYEVTFDGSGLPSGIYFYRLTCGDFSETRKMLLIK